MNDKFDDNESLLRAVFPPSRKSFFWSKDGRLSSAALKDKKGMSVDRTGERSMEDSVDFMLNNNFEGFIVAFGVPLCKAIDAYLVYAPTKNNKFHSEIHGSPKNKVLSAKQALILAKKANIVYEPDK